ncbi:MAG: hypothetical protein DRJ52_04960 [Thermoprotei archaeon]|nr:MAG: hypothetical protein DRJ52_04960 [Thermoprotei archaeon]RLE99130.1 MAG: hypothetical protein DRJ63_06255 [Thermoprotei archaeon]
MKKILLCMLLAIIFTVCACKPRAVLRVSSSGEVSLLEVLGKEVEVASAPVLWVREYTHVLDQRNILVLEPKVVKGSCDLSVSENSVNATLLKKGSAVIRLGKCSIKENAKYLVSGLFTASNGFLDISGGPVAELWVRWRLKGGDYVVSRVLVLTGSVPVAKRFSNFTWAPAGVESAELYLTVSSPLGDVWVYVESPILVEAPPEAYWRPIKLNESEKGVYVGELNGVQYFLKIVELDRITAVEISVENKKPYTRALDLGFFIKVENKGWRIWIDPRTSVPLRDTSIHARVVNSLVSGGFLPTSLYPLSAISNSNMTLGIAVPLTTPALHVFTYFPETGFGVYFPLGLTEAGTKHCRAAVRLELYGTKGEYGLRGIIEEYYRVHSEWFTPSIELSLEKMSYSEYGLGFEQGWFESKKKAEYGRKLAEKGFYLAEYILPWEYEPETGISITSPPPSYWQVLDTLLEERTGRIKYKAIAASTACPRDSEGHIVIASLLRGPNYRPDEWVPRIPMNPDPDISGYNVWNYTLDVLKAALNTTKQYGYSISGVELDNFMARTGCLDFRKEAVEALDHSLVYDPNTFKPAVHLSYAAVEYLKALRRWVSENIPGGGVTGNFVAEGYTNFGLPYLDALPFECSPRFNWGDKELLYRRFAAGYKPVIGFLAYRGSKAEILGEYVETLLFYGILPTLKSEDRELLKENLYLFNKSLEICKRLQRAGWKPVTMARAKGLLVERYGDWPEVYITVFNPGPSPRKVVVEVDRRAVGNSTKVSAKAIWGKISVKVIVEESKIVVMGEELKSKRTAVILLTSAEHGKRVEKPPLRVVGMILAAITAVIVVATAYYLVKKKH